MSDKMAMEPQMPAERPQPTVSTPELITELKGIIGDLQVENVVLRLTLRKYQQ